MNWYLHDLHGDHLDWKGHVRERRITLGAHRRCKRGLNVISMDGVPPKTTSSDWSVANKSQTGTSGAQQTSKNSQSVEDKSNETCNEQSFCCFARLMARHTLKD